MREHLSATARVPLAGVTDGDAAGGGRVQINQVGADPGPGEHAHPGCAVEERGVDDRVGAVGTSPTTLPSYGERISSAAPDRAVVHCPPISNWGLVTPVSSMISHGPADGPIQYRALYVTGQARVVGGPVGWTSPTCGK